MGVDGVGVGVGVDFDIGVSVGVDVGVDFEVVAPVRLSKLNLERKSVPKSMKSSMVLLVAVAVVFIFGLFILIPSDRLVFTCMLYE